MLGFFGRKNQYIFNGKWKKFTKSRYIRDDGCEINKDIIDNRVAWFAMVPNYLNNERVGWVGLMSNDSLMLFNNHEEAILAVDGYLKNHSDK